MSFTEKTAWVSVTLTLLVWGSYFTRLASSVTEGNLDAGRLAGMFIGSVITLIILQIVFAIVSAITSPREAQAGLDEREQIITGKANSAAFMVLNIGVLCVAGGGSSCEWGLSPVAPVTNDQSSRLHDFRDHDGEQDAVRHEQ